MTDLQRIVQLAQLMKKIAADVAALETQLAERKRAYNKIEQEDLPTLMQELGINSMKLDDGKTIELKSDVKVALTERTREPALTWLRTHGFGGLIKTSVMVTFGRGAHEEAVSVCNALAQEYDEVTLKEDVHHSTLKSFVMERMKKAEEIPMDLFNAYPFQKVVMK